MFAAQLTPGLEFSAKLCLIAALFVSNTPSSFAQTSSVIRTSGKQSSSSDIFTSRRLKRAPGWGKRAPGWGKRNSWNDEEFFDESESDLEKIKELATLRASDVSSGEASFDKQISDWRKRAPGWGKRAPGWGKRAPGWGKRAPGWGKRSCFEGSCFSELASPRKTTSPFKSLDDIINLKTDLDSHAPIIIRRAPGWGKRSYQSELNNKNDILDEIFNEHETNNDISSDSFRHYGNVKDIVSRIASLSRVANEDSISADRRAPGWGKRNSEFQLNFDEAEADKRAPGWGKRAPGWGKRSLNFEPEEDSVFEKRAPGWGKRAPGWGKRSYDNERDYDSLYKRAPGWGKRAPGWGKRAPGWGKRSVPEECQELQDTKDDYVTQVVESVSDKCGNHRETNKSSRK